jgi:cytochrome b561
MIIIVDVLLGIAVIIMAVIFLYVFGYFMNRLFNFFGQDPAPENHFETGFLVSAMLAAVIVISGLIGSGLLYYLFGVK